MTKDYTEEDQQGARFTAEAEQETATKDQGQALDQDPNQVKQDL